MTNYNCDNWHICEYFNEVVKVYTFKMSEILIWRSKYFKSNYYNIEFEQI